MARQVNLLRSVNNGTTAAFTAGVYWARRREIQLERYSSNNRQATDLVSQTNHEFAIWGMQGDNNAYYMIEKLVPDSDGQIVDQGGYYILSLWFAWDYTIDPGNQGQNLIVVRTGSDPSSTTDRTLRVETNVSSQLVLIDGGGTTLDTSTATLGRNTAHHLEIYFGDTSSDNWEWWLDGTSQGSGTTGNFANAPGHLEMGHQGGGVQNELAFTGVVFQSGCTSTADRLGDNHLVVETYPEYLNTDAEVTGHGATSATQGGDTLDAGNIANAASLKSGATLPKFNIGATTRDRWIQRDGPTAANGLNRINDRLECYANNATAPQGGWSVTQLADLDPTTTAFGSTVGDVNTTYILIPAFQATSGAGSLGTPSTWPDSIILGVRLHFSLGASTPSGSNLGWELRTDGWTESLGSGTVNGAGAQVDFDTTLTTPTGGWTWSKIKLLEWRGWLDTGGTDMYISRIWLDVITQQDFPDSLSSTDEVDWAQVRIKLGT